MGVGRQLRELVGSRKQLAIASDWLIRWERDAGTKFSVNHVESSLSRCLNDKPEGVRFFFEDPKRGGLLLDVLDTPTALRPALLDEASRFLASMRDEHPRVVIDLTSWGDTRELVEALAVAVEDQILSRAQLAPTVIVTTAAQFRWLPRTIEERAKVERVDGEELGRERTRHLAGDSALVIAPWRYESFERWAAMSFHAEGLQLDPADALDEFARNGHLQPLAMVTEDVEAVTGEPPIASPPKLPTDAIALRRLIRWLVAPDSHDAQAHPPEVRSAWARELGLRAAATQREVIERELRDAQQTLGLAARVGDKAVQERDALVELASRRAVTPAAFRIEDEIHVVAPVGTFEQGSDHPRVKILRIEHRVPALRRLMNRVSAWSADNFIADPFLDAPIAELDPERREHLAFGHARKTLLSWKELKGTSTATPSDWRVGLRSLLAQGPPSAELLLRVNDAHYLPSHLDCSVVGLWDLAVLPTPFGLLFGRESEIRGVQPSYESRGWGEHGIDDASWEASFDSWLGRRPSPDGRYDRSDTPFDDHRSRERWHKPNPCWGELDDLVASVWLGLHRAVRSEDSVVHPSGAIQVHIGAGVCVQLKLRLATATRPVAAFHVESCGPGGPQLVKHMTVEGPDSDARKPGWQLPVPLYIRGGGVAADVSFRFAPWLASEPATSLVLGAAAAVIAAEDDD